MFPQLVRNFDENNQDAYSRSMDGDEASSSRGKSSWMNLASRGSAGAETERSIDRNTLASGRGGPPKSVRVIVRCRPMIQAERDRNEPSCVDISRENSSVTLFQTGNQGGFGEKRFQFSTAFGPDTSQDDFFNNSGVTSLLDSALNGYAATVFAYGQTGSGKTYSMSGTEELIEKRSWSGSSNSDGIMPRSIKYLFRQLSNARAEGSNVSAIIKASYCEIYNEQVYDLLNPTNQVLPVRYNAKKGFYVQDLCIVECSGMDDVMAVISEGHRNRRVGSHAMNKDSSRSHSMLSLYINSEIIDDKYGNKCEKLGKIVFVDLAGSERLKLSKAEGSAASETGAINKSLFTLSKVISTLSSMQNSNAQISQQHIPYRDSKLTKLLMDSLGGNSLTLMIACISPAGAYVEETANTLTYATRAASIKNKPTVHMDAESELIQNLREEIEQLKAENGQLRTMLHLPVDGSIDMAGSGQVAPFMQVDTDAYGDLLPPGLGASPGQPIGPDDPPGMTSRPGMDPEVQRMLSNYEDEISRLKHENREFQTRELLTGSGYQNVMHENELLRRKVEHFEKMFMEQQKMPKPTRQLAPLARTKLSQDDFVPSSAESSRNMEDENQKLRRHINELQNREKMLLQSMNSIHNRNSSPFEQEETY